MNFLTLWLHSRLYEVSHGINTHVHLSANTNMMMHQINPQYIRHCKRGTQWGKWGGGGGGGGEQQQHCNVYPNTSRIEGWRGGGRGRREHQSSEPYVTGAMAKTSCASRCLMCHPVTNNWQMQSVPQQSHAGSWCRPPG